MIDPLAPEPRPSRNTPWSVIGIAVALATLSLLFVLAERVAQGDAFAFDRRLLLALRGTDGAPIGSARFTSMVRDVTALGSTTVLTIVVAFAGLLLASVGRWRSGVLVALACAGGSWTNVLFKHAVARARPDLVPHLMDETSNSFPSGHAANSAIVYLTLATLAWPMLRQGAARGFVVVAAALLVVAIGMSRVYLGVHWPSDVLAGWLFGALWAIGWWRIELRVLGGR
ncbi:phosphatase PAP2 family protein [Sphingomonas sp. 2R-10]|uniref:phosphatase PAP2 family protein n=1 Tax=Sphingomonas sp. 2R-10 TaxID=3045148 RepID=UPI000F79BF07|nr:phosphatase PAP2 family protein [Sphingomonas sp. 2R-10]MDJ0278002.1 phosphatase PAP2 family protein [Sphingomonas sp. 2R-10]